MTRPPSTASLSALLRLLGRMTRYTDRSTVGDSQLFERFGKTFEPQEVIFEEGADGEQMFIIQSGRVQIVKRFAGRNHTLAMLESGDFFGEMAIVSRVQRTATAVAVAETALLAVDREGFLSMIRKNAEIALNIIDKLCRRLQHNHQQMQHFARQNGDASVALHLKAAIDEAGGEGAALSATVDEISLSLELPKEEVATKLDEYLASGLVRADSAGMITVADTPRLQQIIDGRQGA